MGEAAPKSPEGFPRSISIAIVSKGRPESLDDTLDSIFRQTLLPQQVVVVVPTIEDLPRKERGGSVQFIVGPNGITAQRNKALEVIPASVDYVGFFDDDFELKADYLEQAVLFLHRTPGAIALSGHLLDDGHRCVGVHLALPGGRVSEVQRGYGLIANQWYCLQKGTVHLPPFQAQVWFWNVVVRRMLFFTIRKILERNRALDWRGRLKGLWLALWDIFLGRSHPRRILDL